MVIQPITKKTWLFTLKNNVYYQTNIKGLNISNKFFKIEPEGKVTIFRGYSWDGCTPKINIFDLWLIGTPDGNVNHTTGKPNTYYASCLHDALLQNVLNHGVKRKAIDKEFLHYLGEHKARYVYYAMVRVFGGVFILLHKLIRK